MLESNKNLLFIINHAAFFVSHRLVLAKEAIRRGYRVHLIIGKPASLSMEFDALKKLKKNKITVHKVYFTPSMAGVLIDIIGLLQITFKIFALRPTVIHSASPKANLYAGIVSKLFPKVPNVFSISGLGYLYANDKSKKTEKKISDILFRWIFTKKNKKVIVQNDEDLKIINKYYNVNKNDILKISGSGINLKKFGNHLIKEKKKLVILPGRYIKEKGIVEFVEAARIIKKKYNNWRFMIIGANDYNSPSKISQKKIHEWNQDNFIKCIGYSKNINKYFKQASIVCLPSYREGMPKCLLEASASGCAILTTHVPGCKDVIKLSKNGMLCKVKNVNDLVLKLTYLIENKKIRESMGKKGKIYASKHYGDSIVIKKIFDCYNNFS